MLAWAQKESSKTRQKEAACQSEEKAVADHKTSESHSVQGNRGLRQNALSRHRARRSWRSQVERLKDPLVHRAVPVVVLSASPIHRVQRGIHARSESHAYRWSGDGTQRARVGAYW